MARTLKGLTQKELSVLVNLSYDRVRQYESDIRTPRKNLLEIFSDVLGFPLYFFTDHKIDDRNDIFQILFELENEYGVTIRKTEFEDYVIQFNDAHLNDMLKIWYAKQQEEKSGKISKENYELWKATYSLHNTDECSENTKNIIENRKEKIVVKNAQINDIRASVILNLIADKFSRCKNMDEVAEAIQDIKGMA